MKAAILIVGNEILSGRTQDVNIQFIAERLSLRGITLAEVRIVRDEEEAIISAVRAFSAAYDYVFSTGGIGPTHDDITADCMAKAFNVKLDINPEARQRLADYYAAKGIEMNEGRLRMARIPAGAALIDNPVSAAPGFKINNIFVMAGVPKIMQGCFSASSRRWRKAWRCSRIPSPVLCARGISRSRWKKYKRNIRMSKSAVTR